MTGLPHQSGRSFYTSIAGSTSARPYSWAWYGGGLTGFPSGPLGSWHLTYPVITDAEMTVLKNFFTTTVEGRLQEFIFLDPGGNLVSASELLSDPSWINGGVSISAGAGDPWGGTKASACGSGTLQTSVIPSGLYNGNMLTASVWVNSVLSQNVTLGFNDSTGTSLYAPSIFVSSGRWTRITSTYVVASSLGIRLRLTVASPASIFGVQCVPGPGPGAYRQSPSAFGYHARCRFDTDKLDYRVMGVNQNSVSFPIVEYWVN